MAEIKNLELPCPDCERQMFRKLAKNGALHYRCHGRDPYEHDVTVFRKVDAGQDNPKQKDGAGAEGTPKAPVPARSSSSLLSKAREKLLGK